MGWRLRSAHQLLHCLQAEAYADSVVLLQDLLSTLITSSESPLLQYDSLIWARQLGGDVLPWPLGGALLLGWSVCPESLVGELESSLASVVGLDTTLCHTGTIIYLLLPDLVQATTYQHKWREHLGQVFLPWNGQSIHSQCLWIGPPTAVRWKLCVHSGCKQVNCKWPKLFL